MQKISIIPILIFTYCCSFGQIPPGYYNAATGLACQPLKTVLSTIISTGQVTLSYGQLDNTQMPVVDTIRTDDGTGSIIWDIYSNYNAGPEPFTFNSSQVPAGGFCGASSAATEGFCWNKEHTFPRAWFQNMDGTYPVPTNADLFNVRPADYKINSVRASNPYATVGSASYQFPNPGTFGSYPMPPNPVLCKLGPSNAPGVVIPQAFEPPNGVKGDLARAYFYLLTRYEGDVALWISLNSGDGIEKVVDAANPVYPSFNLPYLAMLYNWHLADPVDANESRRNDLVYTQQNNRNPYIDHPEFVAQVWQCTGVIPVTLTSFHAEIREAYTLLMWNATFETSFRQYDVERSVDGISFSRIGEVPGNNQQQYSFTDRQQPGEPVIYYRLKMIDIDGRYRYSKIVAVRNNNFSNAIVFPNPASTGLTISLTQPLSLSSEMHVVDMLGQVVKKETLATA